MTRWTDIIRIFEEQTGQSDTRRGTVASMAEERTCICQSQTLKARDVQRRYCVVRLVEDYERINKKASGGTW